MTGKADFSEEEWDLVAEGPVVAGMIVLTAQSGGSFRETWAMSKTYAEARSHHGESQLLDELVSSKPEYDRHRFKTPEALREARPAADRRGGGAARREGDARGAG